MTIKKNIGDCISRKEACEALERALSTYPNSYMLGILASRTVIEDLASAKINSCKKGKWLRIDGCMTSCSECGALGCGSKYCSNCGARMT